MLGEVTEANPRRDLRREAAASSPPPRPPSEPFSRVRWPWSRPGGLGQEASLYLPTHSAVFGGFPDRNGELDFSTFLTIMHMQKKQEDPKKEILLAMLMADKEKKGYIMASELRSKLMNLGEKLTHKEGNGLFPFLLQ